MAQQSAKSVVSALPQHLLSLDGLRGIAILLVIGHNVSMLDAPRSLSGAFAVAALFNIGWVGVQLFFVLSGFLITRILLQTQSSPHYYKAFFMRRVLRIFPLYYGALLVLLVLLPAMGVDTGPVSGGGSNVWLWLYLVNWTEPFTTGNSPAPHFWSLAVEEQFYLIWPFVIHRMSARQVLRACVVVALAAIAVRLGMGLVGAPSDAIYMFSVCRMDALAIGGAAAALTQMPGAWQRIVRWGSARLMWVGLMMFVVGIAVVHGVYPRRELRDQIIGYTILALVFALIVVAAAVADQNWQSTRQSVLRRTLTFAPLRSLGKYSYGIYIIHKPLHDLVAKPWLASHGYWTTTGVAASVAYVAFTTLVCWVLAKLVYHAFEVHFLALKRYFVA